MIDDIGAEPFAFVAGTVVAVVADVETAVVVVAVVVVAAVAPDDGDATAWR